MPLDEGGAAVGFEVFDRVRTVDVVRLGPVPGFVGWVLPPADVGRVRALVPGRGAIVRVLVFCGPELGRAGLIVPAASVESARAAPGTCFEQYVRPFHSTAPFSKSLGWSRAPQVAQYEIVKATGQSPGKNLTSRNRNRE